MSVVQRNHIDDEAVVLVMLVLVALVLVIHAVLV
jgi:hypothetical protein